MKKQSTIRDKAENGVSETVEENLVKPSAAKLADKSRIGEERTSKFAKSALKSIDKIPKLEDKLGLNDKKDTPPPNSTNNKNSEKVPEKPTLKSVRTIDADKGKEKSVTIVDKRGTEKNGTTPTSKAVNDRPLNKINTNEKASEKPVIKTNTATNEKPFVKTTEKPLSKNNTVANETPLIKKNNTAEKPIIKTTTNDKIVKNNTVNEKPNNKTINDKVSKTTVNDKSPNDRPVNNSASKDSKVDVKPNIKTAEKFKAEPKTEGKLENKKEKTEMATKPPLEKGPSKVSTKLIHEPMKL